MSSHLFLYVFYNGPDDRHIYSVIRLQSWQMITTSIQEHSQGEWVFRCLISPTTTPIVQQLLWSDNKEINKACVTESAMTAVFPPQRVRHVGKIVTFGNITKQNGVTTFYSVKATPYTEYIHFFILSVAVEMIVIDDHAVLYCNKILGGYARKRTWVCIRHLLFAEFTQCWGLGMGKSFHHIPQFIMCTIIYHCWDLTHFSKGPRIAC